MKYTYQVQRIHALTPTVWQVLLSPTTHELVYQAGQYVDLVLPDNERRPFSIANKPDANGLLEFHIRHQPDNAFTNDLLNHMNNKGELDVDGPFGHCVLDPNHHQALALLAGGTGIVPMKALLEERLSDERHAEPVVLFWGVTDTEELYWDRDLLTWQAQFPHFDYIPVVGGTIQRELMPRLPSMMQHRFYVAGPYPMVRSLYIDLSEQGIEKSAFLTDML